MLDIIGLYLRDKKTFLPFGGLKYDEIADVLVFRLNYVDKGSIVDGLLVLF